MATIICKNVKVSDLPSELAEDLDAGPDEVVRVTVDAEHRRNVAKLIALAEEIGAEAERRGLTDEKLAELLDEDD